MKIRKAIVVYHPRNYGALAAAEKALKKHGVNYRKVSRSKLSRNAIKGHDLVIVIGGDGTFLTTAHHVGKTPVFAVCSDFRLNEGFFARACKPDFSEKLGMLLKGKYKIAKLLRLETRINGKKLPWLAVNEVFIGSGKPYYTAIYRLKAGGKEELQKSSGVLIATPAGSNAWAKSAHGYRLPMTQEKFEYVVREPYTGRLTKPKLLKGILNKKQKVEIKSETMKGIIAIDSGREFRIRKGDKIEVAASKEYLNLVEF